MEILQKITHKIHEIVLDLFQVDLPSDKITLTETRKEFEGDTTLVVFPFVKLLKSNPQTIAESIGDKLKDELSEVTDYNVIKGFLNISFDHSVWLNALQEHHKHPVGYFEPKSDSILIEFSSPNTNKPLHLGHIRNILLGWSSSMIQEKYGRKVIKTQIINDRGIAVCKSMLAWLKTGNGATPESTGIKPDHFVGSYYVAFEKLFQTEYTHWQESDAGRQLFKEKAKEGQDEKAFFKAYKNTYFNTASSIGKEAKEMLLKWEGQDENVRSLWRTMNGWVYDGFEETYQNLGVSFDSLYYESDTYLLGKDIIERGVDQGVFYTKEDKSVWIDLEPEGMDQKLVLRSDGTSVYMTQDIGTAHQRYVDTKADGMVYVVADEQDYHFKALFAILKRLEEPYAQQLHHLSYGMVDLPSGRMKSREGTVVDADDLMAEVTKVARENAMERGELVDVSEEEKAQTYRQIGMAALKFFILKVNPKKRMVFNPEESVDMQGTTGPYVQYAYVRMLSILEKAKERGASEDTSTYEVLEVAELNVIKLLVQYKEKIEQAALEFDPSIIAMYAYELAKASHKFIHDVRILNAPYAAQQVRIQICESVTKTLKDAFQLLGIEMPVKM